MELIRTENLSLSYGAKTVVKDLSFSLEQGQRILVCGENGSGKSTLVRALVGAHTPSAGRVVYGKDVRRSIGYLPQKSVQDTSVPMTVREVAASGVRGRGLFLTRAQKQAVNEALSLFGADALSRCRFSALSGGQKQRVLLARARLSAKSALILDEPLTGLDPLITHELYHLLRALSREGLGVLFVSHDITGSLDFCTHVLHLAEEGKWRFYTAEEYKESAHFCALCREVHHA